MQKVKISLAGDLGSGKSTVGRILAEKFGAEIYSTGTIQRQIAESMGMTTLELNKYSETHPEIDQMIDDGLRALNGQDLSVIIDSRMAWHFVPSSFSVYMTADAVVSARRIMEAGRSSEPFSSLDEAVRSVRSRRKSEMYRYAAFYDVNIKDLENYDFVIDTSFASPERVAQEIASHYLDHTAGKPFERYLICAERLLPCAEERGGAPRFVEQDGFFYIAGGADKILSLVKGGESLLPLKRLRSFGRGKGRKGAFILANCTAEKINAWEEESGVKMRVRPPFLCAN